MAFVPHNVLRSRFIFSLVSATIGPWSQEDGWRIWSVVLGMFLWATPKVVYITSIQLQCLKLNYTASKTAKSQRRVTAWVQMEKELGLWTPSILCHPAFPITPHYGESIHQGQTKFHLLGKHFLTTPKGSENFFLEVLQCLLSSCLFTCHSSIIVFLIMHVFSFSMEF